MDKEIKLAKRREWYKNNSDKQAAYNRRYWLKKLGMTTPAEPEPESTEPGEIATE